MCWSPNMPTTCRSIARRKSMRAKASRSIAPPWRIGWAAPLSRCGRCMRGCWSNCKQSTKLFADETTAPVLDPGRGRVKKGQLWAYARDERPWAGRAPPGVAYVYAPDRKHARPAEHLAGFQRHPAGRWLWRLCGPRSNAVMSRSPSAGAMCGGILRYPGEDTGADRHRGPGPHRRALCHRSRHSRPLRR